MSKPITARIRPFLIGSDNRPSRGITLRYPTPQGIFSLRFMDLPMDKPVEPNSKYDGFLLLYYKWKEPREEEHDEDMIFLGIRGSHWIEICTDHRLLKQFLDEVVELHGKERGITILSYKPKTFRALTIDRNGLEFKVKNNKRAECLFNQECPKGSTQPSFKMFSFIPRGMIPTNVKRHTETIRSLIINNSRFVDI